MHELNDDGAFADAGSDAFYRAVADIADHKDAWDVGFEQAGIGVRGPGTGGLAAAKGVWAGEDEAALVAFDKIAKPIGAGLRANEDEEAGGGKLFACAAGLALYSDAG